MYISLTARDIVVGPIICYDDFYVIIRESVILWAFDKYSSVLQITLSGTNCPGLCPWDKNTNWYLKSN